MAESLLEDNYKLMFEFQTKNTKIIKRKVNLLIHCINVIFSHVFQGRLFVLLLTTLYFVFQKRRTITLLFSGIYSGYYPFFGVQHYSIQSIVRVKYLELN